MHCARTQNIIPFDSEIERTFRSQRKKKVLAMADGEQNAQPRTLKDYVQPIVNDNYSDVRCQTINANNFELKPALISMAQQAQFSRSPLDDPNIHLAIFLEICNTVKMNGVTEDTIRLRLFPFSLRDKARGWLQSLQPGTITSWQDMAESFLLNSFHLQKQLNLGVRLVNSSKMILSHFMKHGKGIKI